MNNDFETQFDNSQLDDMRQQMAVLKKKLDRQAIINEHIILKSMEKKMSSIKRRNYILIAIALFMIPYGYWAFVSLVHFSIAFWIATCIIMLISAAATYYSGRDLSDDTLMQNDLVEVRQKVARTKKFEAQWLFFAVPVIILWLFWFFYECQQQDYIASSNGILYGGVIGTIIGAIIGFRIHFKTQRQYQEIIDEIDEIKGE